MTETPSSQRQGMSLTIEEKKERNRLWAKEHVEAMRASRRRWYHRNKKKADSAHTDWVSKNRKRVNDRSREWRTGNTRYWAKVSKNKTVRRQEALLRIKKESGGKCSRCGYCEEVRILHFHHHMGIKNIEVSALLEYSQMKKEAKLCILLCPNCHAITHLKPICH